MSDNIAAYHSKQCPFDVIVITSPDEKSALAVRELIISSCGQFPSNYLEENASTSVLESKDGTLYISTSDPYGVRMGSGGGTIAALAEADHEFLKRNCTKLPTVLICHAGGESSRSPTQIALGKAWTSLPVVFRHERDELTGASFSTRVSNPTSLLIDSLSVLFENVPKGSVIVAASDVLLSFGGEENRLNFDDIEKNGDNINNRVIGISVPAPLETAKNHGVFVVESGCSSNERLEKWEMRPTHRVLQKPSRKEMLEIVEPPCTFQHSNGTTESENEVSAEHLAWIDTGVITFLPGAAATLRELSRSSLKLCTWQGIKQMHEDSRSFMDQSKSSRAKRRSEALSLVQFAKLHAPKICLYSDILHSLRTTAGNRELPVHDDVMSTIQKALSELELVTCVIPSGSFIHLGTSGELLDFLSLGTSGINRNEGQDATSNVEAFGRSIFLTRRALACLTSNESNVIQSSVVLNTCVRSNNSNIAIGCDSLIEHSMVQQDNGLSIAFEVGDRCLVSGLRPNIKGSSLRVPSGICLQVLPLTSSGLHATSANRAFACLCFGVDDEIKAVPPKTVFGVDFKRFLQLAGLEDSDLWDDVDKRMIWNAKIIPVFHEDDEMKLDLSFLEWIHFLVDNSKAAEGETASMYYKSMPEFQQWKNSPRLSISELRDHVNPEAEVLHRKSIMCNGVQCNKPLLAVTERRNEPCNLDYILDFVSNTFSTKNILLWEFSEVRSFLCELERVIWRSAEERCFDIVGRGFMTMSLLLSDINDSLNKPISTDIDLDTSVNHHDYAVLASLSGPFWRRSKSELLSIKDGKIGPYALSFNRSDILGCCAFLEKAASFMVGRCVRGNDLQVQISASAKPITPDTTVVASAPSRIDLSGGWTDTPPISFEHGGRVACLAVTVDERRPLQARCCLTRSKGILLRTESRALMDGELVSSSEVRIERLQDMKDYNDPLGECSLLKCALIYLGLTTAHDISAYPSHCIQPYLNNFCQREKLESDVGLEIVSVSLLPTGSGMGGSSILGGCIVAAIARCIGVTLNKDNLVHAVLMLEQMLTTGGGWQDQIGGLFGGLKLGTSDADIVLKTNILQYNLTSEVRDELSRRLALVFTGKPRLAKGILQNVLRRWARRNSDIVRTVHELVCGASEAVDSLMKGDLNRLGSCMSSYWEHKKIMAGLESGVEPDFVKSLLTLLYSRGDVVGGTLCGAGGEYIMNLQLFQD
eukprot:CCRYP_008896-RB/>CCRYP_008896-RB protein AED:0.00 eAED:0.00 QI:323/1/1/1/1/1/2/1766/1214